MFSSWDSSPLSVVLSPPQSLKSISRTTDHTTTAHPHYLFMSSGSWTTPSAVRASFTPVCLLLPAKLTRLLQFRSLIFCVKSWHWRQQINVCARLHTKATFLLVHYPSESKRTNQDPVCWWEDLCCATLQPLISLHTSWRLLAQHYLMTRLQTSK